MFRNVCCLVVIPPLTQQLCLAVPGSYFTKFENLSSVLHSVLSGNQKEKCGTIRLCAQDGHIVPLVTFRRNIFTRFRTTTGQLPSVRLAVSHAFLVAAAAIAAIAAAIGRVNLIKETSRIFGYSNALIFISLLPSPFPPLQFTPPHRGRSRRSDFWGYLIARTVRE